MSTDSQKPLIIVFSTAYLPYIGGAELAVKEITDRILDYDFVIFTTRLSRKNPFKEVIGRAEVLRVGTGFLGYLDKILSPFWAAIVAYRISRVRKVRVFWSVMVTFTSGAPFILKTIGLNKKTPILLTLQEGDSKEHLERSNLGLTGLSWFFAVRLANHIQAISSYLANYARYRGAKCPISIIPNGVDLNRFKISDLRFKNKDDSKVFTIITTSRLVHKNGIDVLIKAIAELKAKSQKLKARIVGGGPQQSQLEKLASDLNVADVVEFAGEVPPDLIPEYLANADLFVRASRSEGLGSSFLEAMAAGLPVIGTSVGGIPDFLINNETGLFVKTNDPKDLAEKITLLISNKDIYKKISTNGRKLIEEKYSWNQIAREMNKTFKTLDS